jgi:hypothetical protein
MAGIISIIFFQKILQNPLADRAGFFRVKLHGVKIFVPHGGAEISPVIARRNRFRARFDIKAVHEINVGIFRDAGEQIDFKSKILFQPICGIFKFSPDSNFLTRYGRIPKHSFRFLRKTRTKAAFRDKFPKPAASAI